MAAKLAVVWAFLDVFNSARKLSSETVAVGTCIGKAESGVCERNASCKVADAKLPGVNDRRNKLVELSKRQAVSNITVQQWVVQTE